ncbi:hypothetical protein LTR62_001676 [Meristemomyces frigidus]|uniref:Cytochrome P450 n=1 Tax=Meristemomyces frigidus TaxID=1508187 RepID=A0AAN7T917_9PEZI|nr:hypothetical protein LTR62_001676 [Meristemomyces frigidus]
MLLTLCWQQTAALALAILAGSLIATVVRVWRSTLRPHGFPDGPQTAPFVGNLHQFPTSKAFLNFHEWRKTYGDIIGLKFGPQNVVILNNWKHVKELFDKRGGIYSSRPASYIGNELICPGDTHILLVPYSAAWRSLRKSVQALLNVNSVDALLPIQNSEAIQTIHDLIRTPDAYYDHLRRYSTAVVLASVFGQRGKTFNSEKVQALYRVQDRFTQLLEPGATPPIDAFPLLKYLPSFLAPWKREALAIKEEQRALYFGLLKETRAKLSIGKAESCFMSELLRQSEKSGLSEDQIAYLGGILMEAGSDTTASTLLSFCLAMINYPDVLQKCQAEVDALCVDHSPNSDDISKLSYIHACMNEVLRWRPVAAGGIPHVLTEDDVYGDYVIPKGTILFANTWAIHQDESQYHRPAEFIPERWLDNKYGTKHSNPDIDGRRATYGFGAGRRVCSGQRLAENSLMVNMAKLVWTFDITSTKPADASMETGYTSGFLVCPKKFPAVFTVRSEVKAKISEAEYVKAEQFLSQFEE